MPQPIRNWYFEPDPVRPEGGSDHEACVAPGLTCLPSAALAPHGARVLDPGDAPVIPGSEREGWARVPEATVYRARTLLIPADLLRDETMVAAIDAALAPVGMRIVLPDLDSRPPPRSGGRVAEALRRLPRIAGLLPALPPPGQAARPVVVDAWTALQALRAAADAMVPTDRDPADRDPADQAGTVLTAEIVRRIGLEHLLAGSAVSPHASTEGNAVVGHPITGDPITGDQITGDPIMGDPVVGHAAAGPAMAGPAMDRPAMARPATAEPALAGPAISGEPSTEGNAVTGPGQAGSHRHGDTRTPVAVCLPAPARRPTGTLGGRRPVVAVLDTGVRAHPWLDVTPDPAGGYAVDRQDGFVIDDPAIQAAIRAESGYARREQGDRSRLVLSDAWDGPVTADPLVGELGDATGHGTFIAGIVRQAAPDARVLAIRIMHSDDVVYEGDLVCALALLADRIAAAQDGDMAQMVDVVSLSLGYFDESAADVAYSSGLWLVIRLLLDLGVAVVAAAGNYSTSRRFYPAAFSLQPSPVPVISVGALNPNGSVALFSDGGRWVRAWALGASVVSTFPADINGSRGPQVRVPGHRDGPGTRESLDPDDYRGGFATWSGTSFAAPLIAAQIAARLLERALDAPAENLGQPGKQAATDRTLTALTSLGWAAGPRPGGF